ncbi:MAG: FAD:protein FMN transferase, partial [Planctomycetaceae bacterium]
LDRMAEVLKRDWPMSGGVSSSESVPSGQGWLMHGGHSSLLAAGSVAGGDGWPVGVPHPQFPRRTYGTIWLKDRGMSTSGSGVQFYRMAGRRLGHLIDPRTGWPAESVLSVTVLAPTAVEAEALSTAFFVLGVEKTVAYCHNRPEIAAVLFPTPEVGKWAKAVVCNLGESDWMPNLPSSESR